MITEVSSQSLTACISSHQNIYCVLLFQLTKGCGNFYIEWLTWNGCHYRYCVEEKFKVLTHILWQIKLYFTDIYKGHEAQAEFVLLTKEYLLMTNISAGISFSCQTLCISARMSWPQPAGPEHCWGSRNVPTKTLHLHWPDCAPFNINLQLFLYLTATSSRTFWQ